MRVTSTLTSGVPTGFPTSRTVRSAAGSFGRARSGSRSAIVIEGVGDENAQDGLVAALHRAGRFLLRANRPPQLQPTQVAPARCLPAPATPATSAEPSAAPQLTKADVDAWLDGFMPYALKAGDIPGAVVVVVKDGQPLTMRGFGYSDLKAHKPVDPKLTLFRPGSVSKLFTWTAVMQLVQAGKLNLDTDVNTISISRFRRRDGKPITLRNLMTHTPGFAETAKYLIEFDQQARCRCGKVLLALGSRSHLCAGHDAGLFELRRFARRLYRRARLGRAVRQLYPAAHLRSARDDAFDLRPAATGQSQAADVQGLQAWHRRSEAL